MRSFSDYDPDDDSTWLPREEGLSPRIQARSQQSWEALRADWERARKAEDDAYATYLLTKETK